MKNFKTFTILLVLVFSSYLSFSSAIQGNWRWRNDDGNETTATWKASEKTPFNLVNYDNFRLRVDLYNYDDQNVTYTYVLAYSMDDANYTMITDDPATNHFVFSLSGNFEDLVSTTKQLTGGQSNFKAGNIFEVFHDDFSPELTPSTSMELEFCIKATTNAQTGTYYFKVYDYNLGSPEVIDDYDSPLPTLNFVTRRYVTQNGAGTKDGLSWDNAYDGTQLQAAINEPLVTEVWVAAGLYKPTTGADRTISLQMKNGVAIYGGFVGNEDDLSDRDIEAYPTILSGDLLDDDVITGSGSTLSITGNAENSYHVIFNPASLALSDQAVLDGFTVTGSNANGAFPDYIGGVICNNGSSPTIRNCTITGNYGHWGGGIANFGASPTISDCEISSNIALYYGAGVFNFYSSAPELTNCTFDKNKADFGGALYNESSGPTLTDCMISENVAIKGGGVCNHASSPTFTNCTFSTNQASENGGGMYNTTNTLTFDGCTFDANSAKNGGAMFDITTNNSIMVNCEIKSNQATESGGGAFWVHDGCQITLTNCLVHDNTSPTWGGGMIILPGATGTLINCTFSQNASGLGGGIYNAGGTFVINNSILWGNTASQWGNQIETSAGISTTLNYSCFANVYGPDTWDVEGPIVNNASINSNPTFINPGTDDFSVRGNSPCVNAGFNTYNSETTDIRGEARIQNTTIDMGAYEWTDGTDPAYESVFVKYDAAGNNNGTDWPNAFTSLQSALEKTLINGDKIWVAAGTYTPSSANGMDPGNTNPRLKHFRMIPGVAIYGCFEGTEDVETYDLSLRDFVNNQSLLSGNIGLPNDSTDNCYHVFYHPDGLGLTSSSLLNGFEIREAVANGENDFKDGAGMMNINNSPALTLCRFTKNYCADRGGAVYNSGSNPEFRRVRFTKNFANTDGGAVFNNENSDPTFTSCGFDQNKTTYSGGAIYSKEDSNPTLTNCVLVYNTAIYGGASFNQSQVTFINCTFSKNFAYQGGGLCNEGDADIKNCIISQNGGVVGKQIFIKENTTTDINYSDYSNETDDVSTLGSITGANNINTDPLFIDSETGDFRIFDTSPCADAGNDNYNNEVTDIRGAGFGRKLLKTDHTQTGTIDMGAFEYQEGTDPVYPCTNPANGGVIEEEQAICSGTTPDEMINVTLPSGQTGTLEYKWQQSTTSETEDFSDIATSNAESYSPGVLTETTWFKRLARVDCMEDWAEAAESNVIQVRMLGEEPVTDPWYAENTNASANGTSVYYPCEVGVPYKLTSTGKSTTTNDVMHFVYQQIETVGTIIARLDDIDNGGYAGVMIRDNLSPNAKTILFKTLLYNPNVYVGYRLTDGTAMRNLSQVAQLIHWMKIQRNGSNFKVFTSYNGTSWMQRYSGTIAMGPTALAGIFTESVRTDRTSVAWFDNVQVFDELKSGDEFAEADIINLENEDSEVQIYPNPADEQVTISISENESKVNYTITDLDGRQIKESTFTGSELILDISTFKPGLYVLRFEIDGEIFIKRLVVM